MDSTKDSNKANMRRILTPLGASNHSAGMRAQDDYYATDPKALEMLLELESFSHYVWEPACGEGHLSNVLKSHGYDVKSSDLVDRNYVGAEIKDFFEITQKDIANDYPRDIVTNPPYRHAQAFVEHALDLLEPERKLAMFLKIQFLEGKARRAMFNKYPPKRIYVSSSRIACGKNGEFSQNESSAVAYAWYIWEKGYTGDTVVKWFN